MLNYSTNFEFLNFGLAYKTKKIRENKSITHLKMNLIATALRLL